MTDASPPAPSPGPNIEEIKSRFAAHYPRIRRIARLQHPGLYGDRFEDAVADTIAFAWSMYRRQALAGGDPDRLIGPIVRFSAGHVRAGKRLGGSPHVNDVMSHGSRRDDGYFVTALPSSEKDEVAPEAHAALQQRGPDPAEEVACRLDFEDWLAGLSPRQRAVAEGLASDLSPTELARCLGVSHQAVGAIRETLARKWDEREGSEKAR